jgi:DNA-binding protein HU-beta
MNRGQLIDAVAQRTGLDARTIDQVLSGVQSAVTEALISGQRVTVPGFVSFDAVERGARIGRNPQTGASIEIPARRAVRVSAGQALKRAIAGS